MPGVSVKLAGFQALQSPQQLSAAEATKSYVLDAIHKYNAANKEVTDQLLCCSHCSAHQEDMCQTLSGWQNLKQCYICTSIEGTISSVLSAGYHNSQGTEPLHACTPCISRKMQVCAFTCPLRLQVSSTSSSILYA